MGPIKPDVIIFATGYIPSFPFLQHSDNEGQRPYPTAHDADVRQIWKRDDPTIGFIGFIRPGFGAIPPLAEMQSLLFTSHLLNLVSDDTLDPEDEYHYRLIHRPDARVTYGVEHDSYAYQLAKDMNIAPSVSDILRLSFSTPRGWRLPYIWAAGASFNTKFRLVGPWAWDGAGSVMTGELWETVTRRTGAWGNLPLSGTPLLYLGTINLYFYLYSSFWNGLARLGLAKPLKRVNEPKRIMEEMARAEGMKRLTGKDMDWEEVKANGTM
jgi:dimethylaniline monooxygenase (N-oxide forming)